MDDGQKRRKRPVQARSRLTVEAILDAAARIFVEEGYGRLTTNAVAERAGVSIGSLYQYFPNKEVLIDALHERHRARLHRDIADAVTMPIEGVDLEQIRRLVAGIVKGHLVEPALHARFEALRQDAAFAERLAGDATLDDFQSKVEQHLEATLHHQTEPADRRLPATILVATVHALAPLATSAPSEQRRQRIVDEIARMVFGYINALSESAGRPPRAGSTPDSALA